jgi:hypothetical protein
MPPFRNLLSRKPQPNAGDPAVFDENYLSPNQRPAPIPIRNSHDEPTEYKLSGTIALLNTVAVLRSIIIRLLLEQRLTSFLAVVNDSGVYLPVWAF